jgi:AI-2 transport protein TqsA
MSQSIREDHVLRVLVAAAAIAVVVAALRMAATLLVPIAVAAFIVIVSLPPLRWLRRHGLPNALAILVIVLADSALLAAIGWIVFVSAAQVRAALPEYVARFAELEASVVRLLRGWGAEIEAVPYADLVQPERLIDFATSVLRGLTGLVSASVLVLLYLVFMLSEASGFPAKLERAVGRRASALRRYAPIVEEVQQYLALKTVISLATGVLVGLAAAAVGLDFALFWGLLAFLLNFIPTIGSIIAAVPAVSLAVVQLGPGPAAMLAAAYLAVNMLVGNFLDPALMGRRLGLSTLVVILSLAFWGWVWGVAGMLLAVPLTMAAKIALEGSPELRWVAVMMGPALPRSTAEAIPVPPSGTGSPAARGGRAPVPAVPAARSDGPPPR